MLPKFKSDNCAAVHFIGALRETHRACRARSHGFRIVGWAPPEVRIACSIIRKPLRLNTNTAQFSFIETFCPDLRPVSSPKSGFFWRCERAHLKPTWVRSHFSLR